MKKRCFVAAMALAAFAQPSLADPIWEVQWDGGAVWQARKTESGVTMNYGGQFVDGDQGLEFFVDDGDLKIMSMNDDTILTFNAEAGNVSGDNVNGEWVEIPGNGSAAITSLSDSSGKNIIRKDASGAIHIGENSLVTIEEGGRQKMYATNAAGESIDIDITNGSKLLINGRDVEKSIDNVGSLSAALSSVPAVSADSQFTCGLGGGTHSSAYAISGGCASKVSDRVSVNAAIATVINNGTGDSNDNISARAGFTFRLGKIDDSPKVAARKAAALHDEVATLRDENLALMARLERLEAVALGQNPAITTASLK